MPKREYHPGLGFGTETMNLLVASYAEQKPSWPVSGQHILAQYDDASIAVYQAYNPAIGRFAAQHGY